MNPIKWTSHKYQGKAKRFVLNNMVAGLFLSPGLGKTSITLAAISELKKKGYVNKVLLIAPLRVCHSVWPAEIEKWANFNHLKAVVLHGKHKDKLLKEEADIYIINPEGLKWLMGVTKTKMRNGKTKIDYDRWRWRNFGFDTLVIDELSKFKHWSSDRFKMINLVRDTFSRRWGLTGSPAANGLMDLFGQIKTLDGGRSLGPYITQYREQFFDVDYSGFVYSLKPGADKEIYKRIAPLVMQMKSEDYLDLPVLIENNIYVELPPKARAAYNMMQELLIAEIDNKILTAQTAAVKSIKCRQIASGAIFTNDIKEITGFVLPTGPREWVDVHDEKLDALEDLIDELQGNPLLVAYEFEHDLFRLKERLGKHVPHIGKGVSAVKGRDIERAWNAGEIPVLLGQPQCLHPQTQVLTQLRGWVNIIDVEKDDLVFDGVEFVNHEGCSYSGYRSVITKFGITMTLNHKLLIDGDWVEACNVRDCESFRKKALYKYQGTDPCIGEMFALWKKLRNPEANCGKKQQTTKSTLQFLFRRKFSPDDEYSNMENLDGYALSSEGFNRQKLWGAWDYCLSRVERVQELLQRYVGWVCRQFNDRKDQCEWSLQQRELLLGYQHGSTIQQTKQPKNSLPRGEYTFSRTMQTDRGGKNEVDGKAKSGYVSGGSSERCQELNLWDESKSQRFEKVYDLVNCGPRHQFVIRNGAGEMFISHNSMGHGLNLQGCGNHVCWFTLTWNFENYDQFIKRVLRQGNTNKHVFVHHILAKDTIDDLAVLPLLKSKDHTQQGLFKGLQKLGR